MPCKSTNSPSTCPEHDLGESDIAATCENFVAKYEQTYGKNSAYLEAGIEMVAFRATGLVTLDRPTLAVEDSTTAPDQAAIGERQVYFAPAGFVSTQVYDGEQLFAGQTLAGPAIVQRFGDTVVVPPGTLMEVDKLGGLTMHQED